MPLTLLNTNGTGNFSLINNNGSGNFSLIGPPVPTFNFSLNNNISGFLTVTSISGFTSTPAFDGSQGFNSIGTSTGTISFSLSYIITPGYAYFFNLYKNGVSIFGNPTAVNISGILYGTYPPLLVAKDDTILIDIFTSD